MALSSLCCRRRRRQCQLNAERLKNRQHLADFGGLFAFLELYDESQACRRGQGERSLRHAKPLAGLADQPAYVLCCVFHALHPCREVTVREYFNGLGLKIKRSVTVREYSPSQALEKAGMCPYGNRTYPRFHGLRGHQQRIGALSHPVGMTRLDLTLKIAGPAGVWVFPELHPVAAFRVMSAPPKPISARGFPFSISTSQRWRTPIFWTSVLRIRAPKSAGVRILLGLVL
jgi:hypothetical protein